ncbi:MAG: autotransporter domain-containing protein [Pseudomonadota bacterium]
MTNFKSRILRTTALAGVAMAIASAIPAQAAVVNSVTNIQATPVGAACRVTWDVNATGQPGDDPTLDFFLETITDLNDTQSVPPGQTLALNIGTTVTINRTRDITITPGTQRYDKYIRYTDFGGSGSAQLSLTRIPDSTLQAAGGSCLNLIANNAPTVDAGANANTAPLALVNLAGTATDIDNDPLTFQWNQTAGAAVMLSGATTLTPSFTAPAKAAGPQVLTFSLTANDGMATSTPDTVDITVAGNVGPTANAGPDAQVGGNTTGTLDGTGSTDGDGDPITYAWVQTGGPTVTLNGANTPNPTFTAPAATTVSQTLTFQLTVDDGIASATDVVEITIPDNAAPVVNAGQDTSVPAGVNVTLSGSASDLENDPLTFQWTQTGGPPVALTGANTLNPTFAAPAKTNAAQVLTFSLVANDGNSASTPDTVNITIPANIGPVADAGAAQSIGGGTAVTLDGSASSDGDSDPLIYQWTQTSGPTVTLSGANTANPTFTAPAATGAVQNLVFSLTVSDGLLTSAPATVAVEILANQLPIANAGNDVTFPGGSQVTLEGFGSDPDNDPVTLQWTQVSGPSVTLINDTTANPSFTAPAKTNAAQVLTFSLVANDGTANSAIDTVAVTIPANIGPTANAGSDATVDGGASVALDGSGSTDGDGDPLTYAWVQTTGPTVTLSDPTAVAPSFTAPSAVSTIQSLSFDLVVSDGLATSVADSVTISIAANAPPVADAGVDQGPINSGDMVTLDGSGSSDPDNDALTYQWTQISGPSVTLSNATSATPTFVAPAVQGLQDIEFALVVNDGIVDSAPDIVTVSIRGVGTITIIQQVIGSDTTFQFTSSIAALTGAITTSGGTGQLSASGVAAGSHTISASDLSAAGYALTQISCNDSDSVTDLASRSVALSLSPNEDLVCTFTSANSREAATTAITDFLTGRNALILASQPDLQRRLDRLEPAQGSGGSATAFGLPVPGSGNLPFSMAHSARQSSVSTSLASIAAAAGDPDRGKNPLDIWAEAYFASARLGPQEGNFRIIHTGVDYRLRNGLLIGVLGSFDRFSNSGDLAAGEAEGSGWMAGPYVMARLAPQLFGEVRAAWGRSDNRVSPLGTYTDEFTTNRALYSGSLVGQFDIGDATQVRPEITGRFINEQSDAYTDSLNIAIPGQTVGQGDISFRPRLQHLVTLESGWTLRPYGEVEGIYTFGTDPNGVLDNGLRARIEGGIDLLGSGNFRSSLSVFHDGIGSDNFRSTGAHIGVSFGF